MISIIVPVYNSEKTIRECLDSLLNQDFKEEYEIILVDDGSEDNSIEIIEEYFKRVDKLALLKSEHRGPAVARNLGANNARGDILLFTDADCVADKNWIIEMTKSFERKEIVGVQGRYCTKQEVVIAKFAQYEIEDRYDRMKKSEYIDFIGSYSAAYSRDVYLSEGGFNESFTIASGEDPDLSYRLASKGFKMVFNERAIVYHHHPDSLYKYLKQKFYRAYWRVPLYRRNRGKILRDTYTPQILKFQIGIFCLLVVIFLFSFLTQVDYYLLILLGLLFLSTLPTSYAIFKRNKKIGLISPFIILLRTGVFGLGLAFGISYNLYKGILK